MPLSVDDFIQRVTTSGLLDADFVERFVAEAFADHSTADGATLGRELVKQKKLTKFQVEQIYAGKEKSLTLGNYVILDKLGQGGMGMVLKAMHRRMKRLVAIKVMSPAAVKTPDALKRFHREVEAAAKLTHPNIVAAHDADESKGTHFLVMEFVEGTDLSALVKKNGPLPAEQAIRCIIQAARGLEYAHEQGVIHRDIKPANLLIDPKGTVKILDMGLARIEGSVGGSSEGAGLTSTGTIMGTVDYMSPEQAMDTKHADSRSDIYSLGCSLYYLLTGKCLYDGDTMMKKLMAHQNAPVPSLCSPVAPRQDSRTSLVAGLSTASSGVDGASAFVSRSDTATLTALDSVFRRMVAKRPEDRPQSMTEVIAELERCLSGGSATVAFERSGSSATNAAAIGVSGSGNELQDFLRQISGGEPVTATSGKTSGTVVTPSSAEAETMISSADGMGTDPRTEQTLTVERSRLSEAGRGKKSRTMMLGVIATIALVVMLAITFAVRGKSGTLHLELGDDAIEVTIDGMGRALNGAKEHDLRVPLGEHTLHVKREDLEFDTDPFEIVKGEPVTIKVERVGRRVRAMQGNTLLGHKESPRDVSGAIARSDGAASPASSEFALEFDLKSSVLIPLSAGKQITSDKPFTLEVLAKCSSRPWTEDTSRPWPKHAVIVIEKFFTLALLKEGFWRVNSPEMTHRQKFDPNHSYRLAVTSDGKSLRLFVDGQMVGTGAISTRSPLVVSELHVGNDYVGLIDDIRISSVCRYTADYVPGRLMKDADTLALYQFDEGQGDKLVDTSGNNHHGKIVRAKWVKIGNTLSPVWRPTAQQQAFIDAVAKMSADEQVEAVKTKLIEVNPGLDVKVIPTKVGTKVVGLSVNEVANLWPVRALPDLKTLVYRRLKTPTSKVADLSQLAGLPLTDLTLFGGDISDLSPLTGMSLTSLNINETQVSDLRPLRGMALTKFSGDWSKVTDLSPLAGMPLKSFRCYRTGLADLTPLAGMPLETLGFGDNPVSNLAPLSRMSLVTLDCMGTRVSDLSPLKGMSLTSLMVSGTDVRDLSPLAGMPLTKLEIANTRVTDLKPLANMPLDRLSVSGTLVSDLTPLRGMPLTSLDCDGTTVTDLAPLVSVPISDLQISRTSVSNFTLLSGVPLNRFIGLDVPLFHEPDETLVRSLTVPRMLDYSTTPEKFWQAYTARKQAAEEFATATAKLPPDEQVTAVTRRFQELKQSAVGFKPTVAGGAIVEVTLTITDKVVDITPLRALTGLKKLTINGGPHWLDLSPLNSTPLESLTCRELIARRNTHILKSMTKLTKIDARPEPTTAQSNLPSDPPPAAKAPFDAKQARTHQEAWAKHLGTTVETTNSVGAKMILIPPGEFLMGSSDEQVAAVLNFADEIGTDQPTKDRIQQNERPQHKVVITKPFLLCATEVTVGQFKRFSATGYVTEAEKTAENDPNAQTYLSAGGDDLPTAYITWDDAVAYCQWLSSQERRTYRLPTEAEWEYACRAGTTTQYSFGDDYNELPEYGWQNKNAGNMSHPVGTLSPNHFGLFDMHGNLYEWCGDFFDEKWYSTSTLSNPNGPSAGSSRVLRGGSWFDHALYCRSAYRRSFAPSTLSTYRGFRCVAELAVPVAAANSTPAVSRDTIVPSDGWVDLKPLIDPVTDSTTESGFVDRALRDNGELVLGHRTRLVLPLTVDGGFQLRAEFTTWNGPKYLQLDFPIGTAQPALMLAEHDNQSGYVGAGLLTIDGKHSRDPQNPTHIKELLLVSNRKQTLEMTASAQNDQVTVEAKLDDKPMVNWTGAATRLPALPADSRRQLVLATYKGMLKLHTLEFKMLDGQAKLLRPADAVTLRPITK